jgi:hypothetical protein
LHDITLHLHSGRFHEDMHAGEMKRAGCRADEGGLAAETSYVAHDTFLVERVEAGVENDVESCGQAVGRHDVVAEEVVVGRLPGEAGQSRRIFGDDRQQGSRFEHRPAILFEGAKERGVGQRETVFYPGHPLDGSRQRRDQAEIRRSEERSVMVHKDQDLVERAEIVLDHPIDGLLFGSRLEKGVEGVVDPQRPEGRSDEGKAHKKSDDHRHKEPRGPGGQGKGHPFQKRRHGPVIPEAGW